MDIARIAQLAIAGAEPGTPAAAALTGAVERWVSREVRTAIDAALAQAVASLQAHGLAATPAQEPGDVGLRVTLADGCILSVDVTAALGVSAALRDAAAQQETDAPAPWERRFYAALERARSLEARDGFDALDDAHRLVLVLGGLEAEIANGGFEQYLINSAGDRAHLVLDALDCIDAPAARRIVADAFRPFGRSGPPCDRGLRIRAVQAAAPKQRAAWDRLSTRFFTAGECLAQRVDEYLVDAVPGWAGDDPVPP